MADDSPVRTRVEVRLMRLELADAKARMPPTALAVLLRVEVTQGIRGSMVVAFVRARGWGAG